LPTDDQRWTASDDVVVTLAFAADAGQQMLESSPSVSEVIGRLRAFMAAVGLPECEVDATMSSVTLSYWTPGMSAPVTVMRTVRVASPRLGRLSGTVDLLDRVEQGRVGVAAAVHELKRLKTAPGPRQRYRLLAVLASVLGWVVYLNGFSATTVLVALVATLLTAPVIPMVERLGLPEVFGTALVAVVIAAVPNLAAANGIPLVVGPAVVGALYVYLPGVAVVSSVIDGLHNAPLSAVSRGLSAVVTAGALALGMLAGNTIGAGLGLVYSPIDANSVPLPVSVVGAVVGMAGLAIAYGTPRRALAPTLLMGSAGWIAIALLTQRGSASGWVVYALSALVVGFIGVFAAARQRSTTSVYLGVAILPLVPGFTLYRAMLALAQGEPEALSILGDVAIISMSLATGVAVGVAIGGHLVRGGRFLSRYLPPPPTPVGRPRRPRLSSPTTPPSPREGRPKPPA
jgi:uncharacterized membrane protein YjjP (DUF1212 family)